MSPAAAQPLDDGRVRVTLDEHPRELWVTYDPGADVARWPHVKGSRRPSITASLFVVRKRPRMTPERLQVAFAWCDDLELVRVDFSRGYDNGITIALWIDSASFGLTPREATRLLDAIPALSRAGDAQPDTARAPEASR